MSIGGSNVKRRDTSVRRAPVDKISVQGESLTDRIQVAGLECSEELELVAGPGAADTVAHGSGSWSVQLSAHDKA